MDSLGLQAMVNGFSEGWQKERAETQMTLGKLIEALEAMPKGAKVTKITSPHSYRGYYRDLAFEPPVPKGSMRSAKALLRDCKSAMGKVFQGYKGGDFLMGENTPVWIAPYGCCGERIMEIKPDGTIVTAPEDPDTD